ncbi:MAG TPA: ADP-ribosylglycohydrolase family protein [Coleofasciculaceae cyanobacterium]
MRYTPLSRFQGTVLGAAMGNILGVNCGDRPGSATPKFWSEVTHWGFQPILNQPPPHGATWGKVAVEQMRHLIQGQLLQDQPLKAERAVPDLSFQSEPVALQNQELSEGLAIATLPLALFYHEDLNLLKQQIHLTVAQGHPPEAELGAIVVNYAIALALQNRLQPNRLIPQLLAELQLRQDHPVLAEQLTQVHQELAGQAAVALTDALSVPFCLKEVSPIALAFYAFLSTSENFRLSLLRAAQLSSPSAYASTLTLTGALSGAYNGKAVLPPDWRKALRSVPENRSPLSLLWDVKSEAELLHYAQALLAVWSGMYDSTQYLQHSNRLTVVGTPRAIRD